MDIKEQIEKIVRELTGNENLIESFGKDPAAVVQKIVGAIPKDVLDKIVAGVKAKLASDKVSGALDALGGLFKK